MHLNSWNSLEINTVLTHCFLNPQRFDGDMFETSTTTSQYDGTTCTGIDTMDNPTPTVCLELTHHVNEPQSFRNSAHASIQLCLTRTQCNARLNTTLRGNEMIPHLNLIDVFHDKWPNQHLWTKQLWTFIPELGTIVCS